MSDVPSWDSQPLYLVSLQKDSAMGIHTLAILIIICGVSISQNTAGFYMLDVGSKHYLLDIGSAARLEEEPTVNHDTFQPQELKHHDNNGNIVEDNGDGEDHLSPCPSPNDGPSDWAPCKK